MAKRDRSQGFAFVFPEREVTIPHKNDVKRKSQDEPELDLRDSIEEVMEMAFELLEKSDKPWSTILDWLIEDLSLLRKQK